MTQRTIPLPRRGGFPRTVALIVALGAIALMAIGIAAGALLASRPSSTPPSASVAPQNQAVDAVAPMQVVIVTPAPPAQTGAQTTDQGAGGSTAKQWFSLEFRPVTFTTAPANPKTVEERIAAFYLLAAEGKIEEALGITRTGNLAEWREQLNTIAKPSPFWARQGVILAPGSTVSIDELWQKADGTHLYIITVFAPNGRGLGIGQVCATPRTAALTPCSFP